MRDYSGYMFGGVFTDVLPNPFTGSRSCPGHFIALDRIFSISVCVSRNYYLDHRFAVDLGGFVTCMTENKTCAEGYTNYYITTVANTQPGMASVLLKPDFL